MGPRASSESPLASAFVVGIGYIAGALVPVLPGALRGPQRAAGGGSNGAIVIVVVSTVVAFLSGMDVRRRDRPEP